ncbi:MFS transporter, partial [Stenotrophomonas maltophilia]|uniref:MFS transporter n=1 Tax=Stenotrophomonas maltophilia TaxID=40324 RepID=UPI00195380E2
GMSLLPLIVRGELHGNAMDFGLLLGSVGVGAVLGAVLITRFDGHQLKPFISAYLLLMGLYILSKAYRHVIKRRA